MDTLFKNSKKIAIQNKEPKSSSFYMAKARMTGEWCILHTFIPQDHQSL
jgi:hypothetical protein